MKKILELLNTILVALFSLPKIPILLIKLIPGVGSLIKQIEDAFRGARTTIIAALTFFTAIGTYYIEELAPRLCELVSLSCDTSVIVMIIAYIAGYLRTITKTNVLVTDEAKKLL